MDMREDHILCLEKKNFTWNMYSLLLIIR